MKSVIGLPVPRVTSQLADFSRWQQTQQEAKQPINSFMEFLNGKKQFGGKDNLPSELIHPTTSPIGENGNAPESTEFVGEISNANIIVENPAKLETQVFPDAESQPQPDVVSQAENLQHPQTEVSLPPKSGPFTPVEMPDTKHLSDTVPPVGSPASGDKHSRAPISSTADIALGGKGITPPSTTFENARQIIGPPDKIPSDVTSEKKSAIPFKVENTRPDLTGPVNSGAQTNQTLTTEQTAQAKLSSQVTVTKMTVPSPLVATVNTLGQVIVQQVDQTGSTQFTTITPQAPAVESVASAKSIAIQLVPKTLGVVEIQITNTNGRLDIMIQTQTDAAERLLQSELKGITETLRGANLTIEQVTITNNPQLEQQQHQNRQQRDGNIGADNGFAASEDSGNDQTETGHAEQNSRDPFDDQRGNSRSGNEPQIPTTRGEGVYL